MLLKITSLLICGVGSFGFVPSIDYNQGLSAFNPMQNRTTVLSQNGTPFFPQKIAPVVAPTASLPLQNLRFYQQDPLRPLIGAAVFSGNFQDGPSTPTFLTRTIDDAPFVPLKDVESVVMGTEAFDAVSAFATVLLVHQLWRDTLILLSTQFVDDSKIIEALQRWQQKSPLYIYPHSNTQSPALTTLTSQRSFYTPSGAMGKREMHFFEFEGLNKTKIRPVESAEVVSHEAGHAVLDVLRPQFLQGFAPSRAFHEAFADTTSLLFTLSQSNLIVLWLNETGGDLHADKNFVAQMAEQWAANTGAGSKGLRNLDDNVFYKNLTSNRQHQVSTLWSSIFYDALVDSIKEIAGNKPITVDLVQNAATSMRTAFLWSIIKGKDDAVSFQDVCEGMIAAFTVVPSLQNASVFSRRLSELFTQRVLSESPAPRPIATRAPTPIFTFPLVLKPVAAGQNSLLPQRTNLFPNQAPPGATSPSATSPLSRRLPILLPGSLGAGSFGLPKPISPPRTIQAG